MTYIFREMTRDTAEKISRWEYESQYDFYNSGSSEESVQELLNGDYICIYDQMENIIGFFCSGDSARVSGGHGTGVYQEEDRLDIGLGMEPSLTGKGLGNLFVEEGLEFMKDNFKQNRFRLVVASFNLRAISVYKENGFLEKKTFFSKVHGKDTEFVCMETENG